MREYLHLAVQPDARSARPCVGCEAPCACSRSSACACGCHAGCAHAPERLSSDIERVPAEWLPLAWQLAELRVATVTAASTHAASQGLCLCTASLAFADLLAQHVTERVRSGRCVLPWRLVLEGPGERGLQLRLWPGDESTQAFHIADDVGVLAEDLAGTLRQRAASEAATLSGVDELTPRERVVLLGLLDGLSVRTLARHLFVSRHTVRNQMRAIYDKLGVRSHDGLLELFAGRAPPYEVARGRTRRPSTPPRR